MSKFVSFPYLQCVTYALPHTKKSRPTALQDLPISPLAPASLPTSGWGPFGTPLRCASRASCGQVLCLRAELYTLLVSVLSCKITEMDSIFGGCPYCHFMCSLHTPRFSWSELESIILHVDCSSVIVLYHEQIALLVCAFILPGYRSYKLIKLIPVSISMAVYILQPKLLSFNYSFSSISQPVLSPLRQLHLYNSQYPRNDLPEQPVPILPLVQTLLYSFLGCDHFFLCS